MEPVIFSVIRIAYPDPSSPLPYHLKPSYFCSIVLISFPRNAQSLISGYDLWEKSQTVTIHPNNITATNLFRIEFPVSIYVLQCIIVQKLDCNDVILINLLFIGNMLVLVHD